MDSHNVKIIHRLFRALEAMGSATTTQLAARTGLDERCVSEWLHAMVDADRVAHDPSRRDFTVVAGHPEQA